MQGVSVLERSHRVAANRTPSFQTAGILQPDIRVSLMAKITAAILSSPIMIHIGIFEPVT